MQQFFFVKINTCIHFTNKNLNNNYYFVKHLFFLVVSFCAHCRTIYLDDSFKISIFMNEIVSHVLFLIHNIPTTKLL